MVRVRKGAIFNERVKRMQELQKKVLDKIYTSLEPGGYLIIGRKEVLPENTMFEPVYPMDGIYRRGD